MNSIYIIEVNEDKWSSDGSFIFGYVNNEADAIDLVNKLNEAAVVLGEPDRVYSMKKVDPILV